MATLVASQSSSQGNPLEFNSNDTSNLFFGTSSADYLNFSGKGKLTVLDVSNGDVFSFENMASTGFKAKVAGNTVSLLNGKGTEVAKLGGLVSGESITVKFSDGNFMTLAGGATFKDGGSTAAATALTGSSTNLNLNSLKLTEADISASVSSNTLTVTVTPELATTGITATADLSLFGGSKTASPSASTTTTWTFTFTPTSGTLQDSVKKISVSSSNDRSLVDPSSPSGVDFGDAVSVSLTKGSDTVTVDNIAPVIDKDSITTTVTGSSVKVVVPKTDLLGNDIAGVTVDFSKFGTTTAGPKEVEATLVGTNYEATADFTGSATSPYATVTAIDIVGNVTSFSDFEG
jgi:hypothetical protein